MENGKLHLAGIGGIKYTLLVKMGYAQPIKNQLKP